MKLETLDNEIERLALKFELYNCSEFEEFHQINCKFCKEKQAKTI